MTVKELTAIVIAADSLEAWLHENSGTTSDWPADIVCRDEAASEELVTRLQALRNALGKWRDE